MPKPWEKELLMSRQVSALTIAPKQFSGLPPEENKPKAKNVSFVLK